MRRERMLGWSSLDRAAHRRQDAEWLAAAWQVGRLLTLHDDQVLVRDTDAGPELAFTAPTGSPAGTYFLGVADEVPYFAQVTSTSPISEPPASLPAPTRLVGLREVGGYLTDRDAAVFVYALGLAQWHRRHRFCGRCGAATQSSAAGNVRVCSSCGAEHYPRTDPAVIVLVTDDDGRALLGHGTGWPTGSFSTFAGFVEPGESLEQAVAREVFEEVGLQVRDVTYFGNQPWPFPSSLMVGFRARANGTVVVDATEVDDARWFTRNELRAHIAESRVRISKRLSIARHLIDSWLAES